MKLVDILARELVEWPGGAEFAWQDWDKEVRFYGTSFHEFYATQLARDHVRNYESENPKHGVTIGDWKAARAAYLASIQPKRDAEIAQIVDSALQTQQGGTHYKDMTLQPWEAIDAWLTHEQHMGYLLGTAMAYLARYNAEGVGKGGIQDVKKAVHTLQRMIEVSTKGKP
jgi:hypothetical protein